MAFAFPMGWLRPAIFFLAALGPVAGWAAEGRAPFPRTYYISTQGNDRWSGRLPAENGAKTDGPWATLTRARDAIRELKASNQFDSAVVVMVEGGIYRLREPVVLESRDSGTSDQPITYAAYPGDRPVLSGGQCITDWKPYRGGILQATLPEVRAGKWKFRELYCDSELQVRARWPKFDSRDPLYGGWAFVAAIFPAAGGKIEDPNQDARGPSSVDEFVYEATAASPRAWAKVSQAELKIFPWFCWVDDLVPVAKIDRERRIIKLSRPIVPSNMPLMKGNRFYVENVLEELDSPGEWCLDAETGVLYFWPPGEGVADKQVVAPLADCLLELRGTPGEPIHHLTISGLTFTETRSTWPEQRHENFHSPLLQGEAIRLENAEDCSVEDNVIHRVGGDGVRLQGYGARNRVVGNQISYAGGQGVSLASSGNMNTGFWADRAELSRRSAQYPRSVGNLISNNEIHHTGQTKKNGGAIHLYALNSIDNVISNNFLHDTADKGITMQDGFGRVLIENNEITNVCLEICDTGAIMTNRWHLLEGDPDLDGRIVVRNNLIRGVVGCGAYGTWEGAGMQLTRMEGRIWTPYYTWGIYFDNSSMNRSVYNNIVVGTVLGGISIPVGDPKDNVFENNIFVGGSAYQVDLRIGAGHEGGGTAAVGNRFVRNIVYSTSPGAALFYVTNKTKTAFSECDSNLFFDVHGAPLRIADLKGGQLRDWQELGFDRHSVVVDPLFVDAAHGDYRLKPESPAYGLGFRPIETARIGLLRKSQDLRK